MTASPFVLSCCLVACGGEVVKPPADADAVMDAIADATQDTSDADAASCLIDASGEPQQCSTASYWIACTGHQCLTNTLDDPQCVLDLDAGCVSVCEPNQFGAACNGQGPLPGFDCDACEDFPSGPQGLMICCCTCTR